MPVHYFPSCKSAAAGRRTQAHLPGQAPNMYAFWQPLHNVAQEAKLRCASFLTHAPGRTMRTPATSASLDASGSQHRRASSNGSLESAAPHHSAWNVHSLFQAWWDSAMSQRQAARTLSIEEGYHAAIVHAQHANSSHASRATYDHKGEGTSSLNVISDKLQPKALLEDFLADADEVEVNYAALLADLCDLAYDPTNLRADDLFERHQLLLVTTSLQAPYGPITRQAWEAQVTAEQKKRSARKPSQRSTDMEQADEATEEEHASSAAPLSATALHTSQAHNLSEVAAAVAQAVLEEEGKHTPRRRVSSASYTEGAGSPRLTPSVSLVSLAALDSDECSDMEERSTGGRVPVLTFVPSLPPHSAQQGDAARELDVVLPSPASQAVQLDGSSSSALVQLPVEPHMPVSGSQGEPVSSQAGALTTGQPPAAWFACDDPVTKIRYFVIQGSTTLEHWQINLQFEPVIFEDPALGVRVHRGVYMAALKLYDELLPSVRQHLASSPFASVTFTGHSLGGSLATVLMLLMVCRGVLSPDSVSPTYTFGAPAVFCAGAARHAPRGRCTSCALDCPAAGQPAPMDTTSPTGAEMQGRCMQGRSRGLFSQLGLGEEHIVNVIMHRDIVPRAFACDYTLVADLLSQWMPSVRTVVGHDQEAGLPHKSLYSFLGRIAVLQPDAGCSFASPHDAQHPDLPPRPALFRMVVPAPRLHVESLQGSFEIALPVNSSTDSLDDATRSGSEEPGALPGSEQLGAGAGPITQKGPRTLKQAMVHFVNSPHPLTMLSEYNSYGPNGAISRYHNPRSYTLGLLSLIGKAPHQARPVPSPDTLPTQLAPACPLPGAALPAYDAAGWSDLHQLCLASNGLQELAVSPEALRLVKQDVTSEGTVAGKRTRIRTRSRRATSGSQGGSQKAAAPRLPELPLLGSLLSAVGYNASDN